MTTLNKTVETAAQTPEVAQLKAALATMTTRAEILLAAVVQLDAAALEAQRNAPVCDTLAADFVADVTNTALCYLRATITVIGEASLPVQFRSENMYGGTEEEFSARSAAFRAYCKENSIYYYARSREDFSSWVAYHECARANCTKLLMEDMS